MFCELMWHASVLHHMKLAMLAVAQYFSHKLSLLQSSKSSYQGLNCTVYVLHVQISMWHCDPGLEGLILFNV